MDMLLAALLFLFGFSSSEASEPVTLEKIVTAVLAFHEQRQVPRRSSTLRPAIECAGKIDPDPDAPKVKGIYMTGPTAGVSRFDTLIQLIHDTELNAVVLDIKEDHGYMTFEPADPELKAIGNYKKWIRDIHHVMNTLKENDIYPIARIVVFKDTVLANQRPDLSFLRPDGTVWHNGKANPESFVNPYMKEVWDYNIKVAKEASLLVLERSNSTTCASLRALRHGRIP